MTRVCSAHHDQPVTAKGKGCNDCLRERRAAESRRRARREAAREREASKRSR